MAISYIQGNSYASPANNETSKALSFASTTAGNAIIVCCGAFSVAGIPVLSLSDGTHTYTATQSQGVAAGSGFSSSYMWVLPNIAGGAISLTVTSSRTGTTGFDYIIMEYSGLSTASPVDRSACAEASGSGTTVVTTSAIDPHFKNSVLVLFAYDQTNASDTFVFSSTPTLSFTSRVIDSASESQTVDSINTFTTVQGYTPKVTLAKTSNALHLIAAFLTDGATPIAQIVPYATVLQGGTTGTAYSETISSVGGTSPYTFAVVSGSLPAGLSLNTSTGVISGTPTSAGTSSFTIRATDSLGSTGQTAFQIIIASTPTGGAGGSFTYAG